MNFDFETMSEGVLQRLRDAYPQAWSAHQELLDQLSSYEDVIDLALSLAERLERHDLIALFMLMRAYCHPHRLDPAWAGEWLHAYSIIAEATDPNAEEDLEWSLIMPKYQESRRDRLHQRASAGAFGPTQS